MREVTDKESVFFKTIRTTRLHKALEGTIHGSDRTAVEIQPFLIIGPSHPISILVLGQTSDLLQ